MGLTLLLAACQAAATGTPVALLDYEALVPPSLQARPATSSMRLAEFDVSRSDGLHAEAVVYYFGEGQGGSADANIARWSTQFMTPDGARVTPRVIDVAGTVFTTTVAEFEGSYARGVGLGPGAGDAEPDQARVAAVVETPRGNLFLQLFGDRAAVMDAHADFLQMVTSIRQQSGPAT
jgi:hypothetical protein